MVNIDIISNFEKHWCTFYIKKKLKKKKNTIHDNYLEHAKENLKHN
jgi:hypothetical protein